MEKELLTAKRVPANADANAASFKKTIMVASAMTQGKIVVLTRAAGVIAGAGIL